MGGEEDAGRASTRRRLTKPHIVSRYDHQPKTKKRIEEFVDKNHKVMSEYYDLLESATSEAQLKREMNKMIVSNPDYYDPYLVVADLEMEGGHNDRGRQLIHEAYERAVKRIADAQGDWPKCMQWGWLENRHLMRALEREATALFLPFVSV